MVYLLLNSLLENLTLTEEIKPLFKPKLENNSYNNHTVEVFPFVPVIPIKLSSFDGLEKKFDEIIPRALDVFLTIIKVTSTFGNSGIDSQTIAFAPFLMACGIKRLPSN